MTIDALNAEFALAEQLRFVAGQGDLPMIEVNNSQATALISVYGGQVLAFRPHDAKHDLMFLSEKAYYRAGKAIKGGAPICWPWFGADPEGLGRPAHGFVRNRLWSVLKTESHENGATKITLGVDSQTVDSEIWSTPVKLLIEITIAETLTLTLTTENLNDEALTMSQAFHTYFAIGDIHQTTVLGLDGKEYLDKTSSPVETKTQQGDIIIQNETDRIYLDVPSHLIIDDQTWQRRIHLNSVGNKTAVVWNPWEAISTKMADLTDDAYQQFICVETTNAASDSITIPAKEKYSIAIEYRIEELT